MGIRKMGGNLKCYDRQFVKESRKIRCISCLLPSYTRFKFDRIEINAHELQPCLLIYYQLRAIMATHFIKRLQNDDYKPPNFPEHTFNDNILRC